MILAEAFLITGNIKHYPSEDLIITPAIFLQLYQVYLKLKNTMYHNLVHGIFSIF